MSTFYFSILLGLPLLSSLFCAVVHRRRWFEITTLLSSGLVLLVTLDMTTLVMQGVTLKTPKEWFCVDALSMYLMVIISGSTVVAALYSVGYLHNQIRRRNVDAPMLRLYYVLLNVFLFTMLLVLISNNLGFLWIGTESTTLATAFLVAFYEREGSIEAAWKYVIICSVGIALALFGIILTYFSALHIVTSGASAMNWSTLVLVARQLDPDILKLAFIFILVGFGTKAGLAPMHTWKPDAYSEAPAPISALMATGLVNVAIYALLRFFIIVNKAVDGNFASNLFIIFGLGSMIIAVPFILIQRDFKRLLAYSSVEHVGIIVFAFGIGTHLGYFGGLLHMLNNSLAKLILFLTAGNIRLAYNSKIIRRVTGAIKVIPVTATLFILGVFAITGWPPFGVFTSEMSIVTAGFSSGMVFPSILFVCIVATIFIGFIYYATGMVFGEPNQPIKNGDTGVTALSVLGILVIFLLITGTMIPSFLVNFIQNAVAIIQR
ncbi:MAG: hydrogenase 4 subunit F [Bacteroidota bacterium]